jgi:hypothetical protein
MRASFSYLSLTLTLAGLTLACGSTSHKSQPVEGSSTSGAGGVGTAGGGNGQGGNSASGGKAATGGTSSDSFSPPPCDAEDNTLVISTGDVLTDLPSTMTFTVFDAPTSKQFTGNGSNGDVRVYLPEPAGTDRIFPTATVVDPLDRKSANVELVLASGFVNARYVVATGEQLYAEVTADRVALTLCDVTFYPASDPPGLPEITVSGRIVAVSR